MSKTRVLENSIYLIVPYRHGGAWVFDDPKRGLDREPFVGGADDIIDQLIDLFQVPGAKEGFLLLFSSRPFVDAQVQLDRGRKALGGTYYTIHGSKQEGWLCPALFKYFKTAPKNIYVEVRPRKE